MVELMVSGNSVGSISEEQFISLQNLLEEESLQDKDYYVDASTIEFLEESGADVHLTGILRRALGSSEGIEVSWQMHA
jgi:hypothetical protein